MKIVKEHLTEVICGVVILLALGICVWPTMSWGDALKQDMTNRYAQAGVAKGLIMSKLAVTPDGPILPGATMETNVLAARAAAERAMKEQADAVEAMAATQNHKNRIVEEGGREIPLLSGGKQEDRFLPSFAPTADPHGFDNDYEKQFHAWETKLHGGVPPTATEVAAEVANKVKENLARSTVPGPMRNPENQPQNQLPVREQNRIRRAAVLDRAAHIYCYVDETALQKREFYNRSTPPNVQEIFAAFVDSWFQDDVVNAISTLNEKVLANSTEKNVGHAPIKRLEAIIIGNGALSGSAGGGAGTLFMGMANTSPTASPSAPTMVTSLPTGLDFSRSLTGHVGGSTYDVVLMKVVVDIDPAYENQFIQQLYLQNNGYTELNRSMKTVDPLDATSNGYIYGNTQVVRVELLFECLLFRNWTLKLMPDPIRNQLGIPAPMGPMGR